MPWKFVDEIVPLKGADVLAWNGEHLALANAKEDDVSDALADCKRRPGSLILDRAGYAAAETSSHFAMRFLTFSGTPKACLIS